MNTQQTEQQAIEKANKALRQAYRNVADQMCGHKYVPRETMGDKPESAAQHSPLPWEHNRIQPFTRYDGEREDGFARAVYSGNTPICMTNVSVGKYKSADPATQDANAAFIVRACNNAHRLADALSLLIRTVNDTLRHPTSSVQLQCLGKCAKDSCQALAQWEKAQ